MRDLLALGEEVEEAPRVIECRCDDAVARERLETDLTLGRHPARNRTMKLYLSLKARMDPLTLPRLVLDTGTLSLEECVARCLRYVRPGQ